MSLSELARSTPPGALGSESLDGEDMLVLADADRLAPFLMSLPSDGDLWTFVSSTGGLTAGRVSPDGAIFPYVTVDRLHDAPAHTGPITLLRATRADGTRAFWRPFAPPDAAEDGVVRRLLKSVTGDRLVFEETHAALGLRVRARWATCPEFGHVRTMTIDNRTEASVRVEVLDGLRNLLPAGVPLALDQHSSSLVDAYKQCECDAATGLATVAVTSRITDRAEPGEMLRATVAWSAGLPAGARVTLAADAPAAFRRGLSVPERLRVTGERGNYFVHATFELAPLAAARWAIVADASRTQTQVVALHERLRTGGVGLGALESSQRLASERLRARIAAADGVQVVGRPEVAAHHFANVLFNVLRGGTFADDHAVPAEDFAAFVAARDRRVAGAHAAWLASRPARESVDALRAAAAAQGDPSLERLAYEYLPIWFGRRHGDPSRPWNRFAIRVEHEDGRRRLDYEGNWRDIFQNWEALALGDAAFLPNMIARFVNASTPDGFNPYRVSRDGIDWEVEEPGEPWSNIGYWGDHQIVYLTRLLEALHRARPGALEALFERRVFAWADVPYRIVPFPDIVRDPRATIRFDHAHAARVAGRVRATGGDGRLVADADGGIVHATLLEKLVVPVLAKLSNLVPGAGIWMNTQRPEWNDANNALVGHGVSAVTLAQLRRHVGFLRERLTGAGERSVEFSSEVAEWMRAVHGALARHAVLPAPDREARARWALLRELGEAFSTYRSRVATHGFTGTHRTTARELAELFARALEHLDHALARTRRDDALCHAYGLLALDPVRGEAHVRWLPEMLEGQVAALGSGTLGPVEAVRLLDALFASALYRDDQRSFMLYPERVLPGFLEKNRVPAARVAEVPLLRRLLEAEDTRIVTRDACGTVRFHADLATARDLECALATLAAEPAWCEAVARDRPAVLDVYEGVFHHDEFTGRSGSMYAYEGIGSIYWHMVAKLLLAVQEMHARAHREGAPAEVVEALAAHYRRVRAGLGFEKTPAEYGAFPTDPYSHTPRHAGAQQPGMTGQVKEEILTRFGELGVEVEDGRLAFRPMLLDPAEFLTQPAVLDTVDVRGRPVRVDVPAGGLAFTFAGTPVVLQRAADGPWIRVLRSDGGESRVAGDRLDAATSEDVLSRGGRVARLIVGIAGA